MIVLGWIVVDAIEIPIQAIQLRGGKIHFFGHIHGPTDPADGAVALRGLDGHLAVVGGQHLAIPPLRPIDRFDIDWALDIDRVEHGTTEITGR